MNGGFIDSRYSTNVQPAAGHHFSATGRACPNNFLRALFCFRSGRCLCEIWNLYRHDSTIREALSYLNNRQAKRIFFVYSGIVGGHPEMTLSENVVIENYGRVSSQCRSLADLHL
jgi:hypothetical protein